MTPKQAVKAECRKCKGGQVFQCEESKSCDLNRAGRPLPKIKAHCKTCNGDDHPRECAGKLLDGGTCNLHQFRLGKNPSAKKRTLSPEHKAKLVAALSKHRQESFSRGPFSAPGSTISPPGVLRGIK